MTIYNTGIINLLSDYGEARYRLSPVKMLRGQQVRERYLKRIKMMLNMYERKRDAILLF